jgi:hypothetical protein
MSATAGLEIFRWSEPGYQPLVFSQDWQVALLNWEPAFDLPNIGEIERHNQTDEVFILIRGRAVLFTITDTAMQAADMQPGAIYNVLRGSWHNLISTRDAAWIIVENRDTHLHDCEFRRLSESEQLILLAGLPAWATETG